MEKVKKMIAENSELLEHDGFCLIDLRSRQINYANESFLQLIGRTFEDTFKYPFHQILDPIWLPEPFSSAKLTTEALPNSPKTFEFDYLNRRVLVNTSYVLRFSSDEEPTFLEIWTKLQATDTDNNITITRLDNLLREREENLQAAFDAGNFGSCGIDFITGEVTLSERSRDLFGLPLTGDVTWEAILVAVDEAFHEEVNQAFTDCLEKGKSVNCTYSIQHLITGEKRWIKVVAKVHHDAKGNPLKVLGIVLDVTNEIKEDERKNDFIAMVSHELKTPLTAVNAYTQMITKQLMSYGDSKLLGMAQRAMGQIGRMSDLINGFLHISRLEAGKMDLRKEPFALMDLLKNVEKSCRDFYPAYSFTFSIKAHMEIHADQGMLEQVLNNLISNATKYSSAGSTIQIEVDMGSRNNLELSVTDKGVGIAEADLPQVFDRFYRSRAEAKRHVSGFGIGLYLCRQIIDLHGGNIWVDSKLGVGTTVSFTIPLKAEMILSA
ncbi:ATP-binding protein [Sphingobacterium corticis]|uniref:histidine kinase n=1 Tax=Sphingobacterium corticis TaxID=1812823 RepID=A0ABW5NI22_9SPHI